MAEGGLKMFHIGDVSIPNRVVLAPMAGVSNYAFRLTVKEFGAGLVYAEIIRDKRIDNKNKKTMKMLYIEEQGKAVGLEVFGGEKNTLVQTAQFGDQHTNAGNIRINMG